MRIKSVLEFVKFCRFNDTAYSTRAATVLLARNFSTEFATADEEEVRRFSRLASDWWDEGGSLKALHSMNEVRIPWIRDTVVSTRKCSTPAWEPLKGAKILDVGCGAGILCEPLARLGAEVTGLDASEDCVAVAQSHCSKDSGISDKIRYLCLSPEDLLPQQEGKYNAVVACEVLEHVQDREEFIKVCVRLVKPHGLLFFTTLNRTLLSRIFAVFVAEKVLRIVPPGIHEWEKFTPPEDLEFLLEKEGCGIRLVHGLCYSPLRNRWKWSRDCSINYALHAVRYN